MKRILFLLTIFVLSAAVSRPLMAQDNPFVGTWKLNVAKSKFTGTPAPKEMTREVTAAGSGAKYSFTGTDANGGAISYSFTTNYDGKDSAITGSGTPGGADTVALKRINAKKVEGTLKKGAAEVAKVYSCRLQGWKKQHRYEYRKVRRRQEHECGERLRQAVGGCFGGVFEPARIFSLLAARAAPETNLRPTSLGASALIHVCGRCVLHSRRA